MGWGGRKSSGVKIVKSEEDNTVLICDTDEEGNIIEGSCREVVGESKAKVEKYSFPEKE